MPRSPPGDVLQGFTLRQDLIPEGPRHAAVLATGNPGGLQHCHHGGHEFADRRIEGNRTRGAFGGAGVDPMRASDAL